MNGRTRVGSLALLCGVALLVLYPPGARTQPAAPTYTVKADDTMLSIAQQICPPQATVNQMGLALVRANAKAFGARAGLTRGTTLTVPDLKTVQATDADTAEHEFNKLWRGEQHYKAGRALEKSNHMFFAFVSYVEAAKLGHGLAQYRLGQLYDGDFSGFVQRDLQESARWYEKARVSQVDIPRPGARSPRF